MCVKLDQTNSCGMFSPCSSRHRVTAGAAYDGNILALCSMEPVINSGVVQVLSEIKYFMKKNGDCLCGRGESSRGS